MEDNDKIAETEKGISIPFSPQSDLSSNLWMVG